MARHQPAAGVATWHGPRTLWLDHAAVGEEDLEWMAPAESLILWNVRLPEGALARLPNLRGISLRGGSGPDLAALEGCRSLIMVDVNQVRGLHDLRALAELRGLELLSLYGLPKVTAVPSLRAHEQLRHVHLGSMKGLQTLAGVAAAPNLEVLHLLRVVGGLEQDVDLLAGHPALAELFWHPEGVPMRVVDPVRAKLRHLSQARAISAHAWMEERLRATL